METHFTHSLFDRRPIIKSRAPAVKWSKQWVPQDVIATGGKCLVLKWVNEATLKSMKAKPSEQPAVEPEPEPTTEVLFLCSYEGCGKTFIDAGALKKHSHIHGERQYVCHYENCGKKFLDSSKLKRHFLIHTGERHFVCPHEGCGKAFSLDFNLRSHMKTHSQENYHICPYPECGKRYAHEYKLRNHIASHHEKLMQNVIDTPKYTPPPEKPMRATPPEKPMRALKSSTGPASSERPYACPYEGCEKAYIHEYKLNLHLRREHPGHFPDENAKKTEPNNGNNDMDEGSDLDAYGSGKRKSQKQNKRKANVKMPPSKVIQRKSLVGSVNVVKKSWPPVKEEVYEDEDSEETEEERENIGEGWKYGDNNNNNNNINDDDDEETEYED
ncbi:Transcriptional repressor protein yy1 [Castilleja foliolosa]|uniref:Transcriptional repressor protein yy1 n=1 Tax=Castilleja foliolosa TaxID=1961234 RepID=A0ABD3BU72_9LAMI